MGYLLFKDISRFLKFVQKVLTTEYLNPFYQRLIVTRQLVRKAALISRNSFSEFSQAFLRLVIRNSQAIYIPLPACF